MSSDKLIMTGLNRGLYEVTNDAVKGFFAISYGRSGINEESLCLLRCV